MFHVYVEKFRCNKKKCILLHFHVLPHLCRHCLRKSSRFSKLAFSDVTKGAATAPKTSIGPFFHFPQAVIVLDNLPD